MSDPTPSLSDERKVVAGATLIMMASILASRLLGLVRNAVISHQLGQKFEADVYYGAFQIPDLLFYLVAGGALSSAFIPVFTELRTQGKEKEAWHVLSTVVCVMFVVVSLFVVAAELFANPFTRMVNPGFAVNPRKLEDTVRLTRIVLPAQICFIMGGILMGAQYSMGKFRYAALGPVIYNLGIIFGGLVLGIWLGMEGLVWGAVVGAILGNFALQWWAARKYGMQFHISFDARHPHVKRVWKLMLPVVMGVALPQVSIWINRAFATTLGDGPISALTNANQLMQVPLGIFAQAMAVAIFPTLSALAAQKRFDQMRDASSGGIRALLFLTIPSSAFMIVLAVPIIQLLLQQGKFLADDTALAASALQVYCAGIFAWSAHSILSRSFYALHDARTPVAIGTAVTLVFVPMNIFFMKTLEMGIRGLALATTVAATLHMLIMMWFLSRRLGGIELRKLAMSVGKTALASLAAGAACWTAKWGVDIVFGGASIKLHAAAAVVGGFSAGAAVYVLAAKLLRAEELSMALSMLRRKRGAATSDHAAEPPNGPTISA